MADKSLSEPHQTGITDLTNDGSEHSDCSSSTISLEQLEEGEIIELTSQQSGGVTRGQRHPSSGGIGEGEIVYVTRSGQDSSASSSRAVSHESSNYNQPALELVQLTVLNIASTSYSLTGNQLRENSLQPGYRPDENANQNSLERTGWSDFRIVFVDDIKHEMNPDYPNLPLPPLPKANDGMENLEKHNGPHRFSKQVPARTTVPPAEWTRSLSCFSRQADRKFAEYMETQANAEPPWWQILVDVREAQKQKKSKLERQKPLAITDKLPTLDESTSSSAAAITNVAQTIGQGKGKQDQRKAAEEKQRGRVPSVNIGAKGTSSPVSPPSAKKVEQGQDTLNSKGPNKMKKSKGSKQKKKDRAKIRDNNSHALSQGKTGNVNDSVAEDPAIVAFKRQTAETLPSGESQIETPMAAAISSELLEPETLSSNDSGAVEKAPIRPAIPLKMLFKPQRSPSSPQIDKVSPLENSKDIDTNDLPAPGFKFNFGEPKQELSGPLENHDADNIAAGEADFQMKESIAHKHQTPSGIKTPTNLQKHVAKAQPLQNNSESATNVESKSNASPDRDQAAAIVRLEASPPSIDELRGRRLSNLQDRADSIKFLRERTLSRGSVSSATKASNQGERLSEAASKVSQASPALNPMADAFIPAAALDNDGWEMVSKSQKRKVSKTKPPTAVQEKHQPPHGRTNNHKQPYSSNKKDIIEDGPRGDGFLVQESDFPALPQKQDPSGHDSSSQSHHKHLARLKNPQKSTRESFANLSQANKDSFPQDFSTASTDFEQSSSANDPLDCSLHSPGKGIVDSTKNWDVSGVVTQVESTEEAASKVLGTALQEPVSIHTDQSHIKDTDEGVLPERLIQKLIVKIPICDTEQDSSDHDKVSPVKHDIEDEYSREAGPAVVVEPSRLSNESEGSKATILEVVSESPMGPDAGYAVLKSRFRSQSEPALPSGLLVIPSTSAVVLEEPGPTVSEVSPAVCKDLLGPSEVIEQKPVIFDKPDYSDPRIKPGHPEHIPREHIHWYQAHERAGHEVYRVSLLKFTCAYSSCMASIQDPIMSNTMPPKPSNSVIICNGCGPFSSTRYCSRKHAMADSPTHFRSCGRNSFRMVCDPRSLPTIYQIEFPQIINRHGYKTQEHARQRAWFVHNFKQKPEFQIDYMIFNDYRERQRLGYEVRGGIQCTHAIVFPKGDPKKDMFNRLFNIALFDNHLVRNIEMMWRLIREHLSRSGQLEQKDILYELATQFWYEYAVDPLTCFRNFKDVDIKTEWEGDSGMRKVCEEMEAKHWILRAWRREHTERTFWRRVAGIGFPGVTPLTVQQAQAKYAPRFGWGWNGWGLGNSEFFSYD